ncbi:MAG: CDP-diacylglycerol--glycerol-3-phosphate 3-phosphatidyltransferase [Clostridia bacterium]|nr:CDP-diacylglycerol--glycerol-3-phosphate 3-phosphatidyltransferase [Clostridia bacterium]
MNLPNKLTLLRIILIPVFVAVYFIGVIPYNYLIAAVIFVVAALTDFLDGYLARKKGLVTDLGKFLDPVADKVLVASALIVMLVTPYGGSPILPEYCAIFVAVILARELIISGFRMVAAAKGKVIAADKVGKWKTFTQDIAITVLLVGAEFQAGLYTAMNIAGLIALGAATVLTIISGTEAIIKNASVLKGTK